MFSRIFGRDRDADKLSNDQYLPMFSDAFQSIIEYGKYDPRDDMNVLLEELSDENQSISSQELVNLLASRDNPFSRLLESRAKLKAVKPEDRRFSNNLHRRIIFS